MALIQQCTWVWTGLTGLPGYTNFYIKPEGGSSDQTAALDAALAAQREFWRAVAPGLPSAVTISAPALSNLIQDTDGLLTGTVSPTSPVLAVTGGGGAAGPLPSGSCTSWKTGLVVGRRHLQGRTFVVPLAATAYQADGTLTDSFIALQRNGSQAYRTTAGFTPVIWARPHKADPTHVPPKPAVVGTNSAITGSSVTDQAAVLRTRRN